MGKIAKILNVLEFDAVITGHFAWGIFLSILLPFMNYLTPVNSAIGRLRFPISIYAGIVGLLYLISGFFILKRKSIGLKLAIAANILGIPFLMPIIIGLGELYYFTRSSIKEQFK